MALEPKTLLALENEMQGLHQAAAKVNKDRDIKHACMMYNSDTTAVFQLPERNSTEHSNDTNADVELMGPS